MVLLVIEWECHRPRMIPTKSDSRWKIYLPLHSHCLEADPAAPNGLVSILHGDIILVGVVRVRGGNRDRVKEKALKAEYEGKKMM